MFNFPGYATHCSMQLSQQLKACPGSEWFGKLLQWRGAFSEALRMWEEEVRTEIRGHWPGLRRAQGQTAAQEELLWHESMTEGMCLQIRKCNQWGLEALCMRTRGNQPQLSADIHCAGGPLTESLKHRTVLPTTTQALLEGWWFPKAVVRGETSTVTGQAARKALYRERQVRSLTLTFWTTDFWTSHRVCHIPIEWKLCQLLTRFTDSI